MAMKWVVGLLLAPAIWAAEHVDRQVIEKSFSLSAGDMAVEIRGFSGAITVTGGSGDKAVFRVEQLLEAPTQPQLDELKRAVQVQFTHNGGTVRAEVDGPWHREKGDRPAKGAKIQHTFTVTVPRSARLEIRNVNGAIEVNHVAGAYALKTVNGPVTIGQASGAGTVESVNGALKATFQKAPKSDLHFKTVNGGVDVWFPNQLDADFRLTTVNGKIYSDFDMESRAAKEGSGTREGGKWVYRSGRGTETRVGRGGPLVSVQTVNGSLRVHELGRK